MSGQGEAQQEFLHFAEKVKFRGYLQFAILFFVIEIGTSTLILSGIYGSPNDNSATSTTHHLTHKLRGLLV
ncbi:MULTISPECIES: hypothetical protein [Leptospira]|uniref:hypothetical protein n=1 Tax=Leptospira TaxID=171 RepID=UPI0018DEDE29|nr:MULTISPECIES: hypothetical protein [Leptospira]MDL5246060.1 hypothetical protein [Leptospira weilii]